MKTSNMEKKKIINEMLIVYFSGTGNTKIVADEICRLFKKKEFNVKVISIEDKEVIKKIDFSNKVLGIGFPAYTFNYPSIMNNALEFITINKNPVPAFIFSTRAWNSGDSMQKMARVLKKKNIYTIQMQGFNCPSNGWATFLKPSHIIYKLMVRFEKNLFKNI